MPRDDDGCPAPPWPATTPCFPDTLSTCRRGSSCACDGASLGAATRVSDFLVEPWVCAATVDGTVAAWTALERVAGLQLLAAVAPLAVELGSRLDSGRGGGGGGGGAADASKPPPRAGRDALLLACLAVADGLALAAAWMRLDDVHLSAVGVDAAVTVTFTSAHVALRTFQGLALERAASRLGAESAPPRWVTAAWGAALVSSLGPGFVFASPRQLPDAAIAAAVFYVGAGAFLLAAIALLALVVAASIAVPHLAFAAVPLLRMGFSWAWLPASLAGELALGFVPWAWAVRSVLARSGGRASPVEERYA